MHHISETAITVGGTHKRKQIQFSFHKCHGQCIICVAVKDIFIKFTKKMIDQIS